MPIIEEEEVVQDIFIYIALVLKHYSCFVNHHKHQGLDPLIRSVSRIIQ